MSNNSVYLYNTFSSCFHLIQKKKITKMFNIKCKLALHHKYRWLEMEPYNKTLTAFVLTFIYKQHKND